MIYDTSRRARRQINLRLIASIAIERLGVTYGTRTFLGSRQVRKSSVGACNTFVSVNEYCQKMTSLLKSHETYQLNKIFVEIIIRYIIRLEPTPFPANQDVAWLGVTLVYWTVCSSKIDELGCSVYETMIRILIVTGKLTAHLVDLGQLHLLCSRNTFSFSQN